MGADAPTLPLPGQRLGAYDILSEVARGGMAAVYVARKQFEVGGLGKLFAVKVLLPHLREREFVDMFLDEARVSIAMSNANVVQVVDVGESDGIPYIVMEYLRGRSLGALVNRLRASGGAPDGVVFQILAQAAAGLHAAHHAVGDDGRPLGIIHRDVTPQNIHVGYDGSVKLVDFGIAASRGRLSATRPNMLKGTLHYLAPEQISRSGTIDRRIDLWALGVVAWEALVGRQLFKGDTEPAVMWSVVNDEIPDIRSLVPSIPDDVAGPIMDCLQRDPARRLDDTRTLELALTRAADRSGAGTRHEIARTMEALFGGERARDEEQLGAHDLTPPPAATAQVENDSPVRVSSVAAPMTRAARRPRRVRRAVLAAVVTGVAGGAALFGVDYLREPPAPQPAAAAPPTPTAAVPSPEPTPTVAVPSPEPTPPASAAVAEPAPPPVAPTAHETAHDKTVRKPPPPRHPEVKVKPSPATAHADGPKPATAEPPPPPAPPPPVDRPPPPSGPLLGSPYKK